MVKEQKVAETVNMSLEQYQAEYQRLLVWRERWSRLSSRFEPGRLAARQERIEERARTANQKIGRLINEFDRQQRKPQPAAMSTARCPINENEVRNRVGRILVDVFGPQHVRRKNAGKLARQCAELQEEFTVLIMNLPPIEKASEVQ